MRYRPEDYASALGQLLADKTADESELVKKFIELVVRSGDRSYLPKIIDELESLIVRKSGGMVVDLEFAREPLPKKVEELKSLFKERDRVRLKINAELVAGVRITENGERELDATLAGRLKKMFNS